MNVDAGYKLRATSASARTRAVSGNGKKLAFNRERQSIGFGPPHVTLTVS